MNPQTNTPIESLKRTALYSAHTQLGAKMVPFAGYSMPVQYKRGLMHEHLAVRSKAGLFDVSHMGVLELRGPEVRDFLNEAFTRDLSKLQPGRAAYTLFCYEDGGTVDDLIVYCAQPDKFFLVLNASNKEKDLSELRNFASQSRWKDSSIEWIPHFESLGLLALQGPQSFQVLRNLGWDPDSAPSTKPFTFLTDVILDKKFNVHLAFTGYTGEKGCEIFCENSQIAQLWESLLARGQKEGLEAIGLGARDTLRTEMGYSLYGHELSETINPLEAGLAWAVNLKKENFRGLEALKKWSSQPTRKIIALRSTTTKQAARAEMAVVNSAGQKLGYVSSGTFAPSLGYPIALALVNHDAEAPVFVDLRGQKVPFEVCERPFLKSSLD